MAYENAVDILMRFVLDKQSVKDVESGVKSIENALDDAGKSTGQFVIAADALQTRLEAQQRELNLLQGEWRKTQRVAQAAEFTFRTLFVAGAAVTAAITGVALSYVETLNKAQVTGDATLNRWNTATAALEKDKMIVGQIATEALLPLLETAADLADKATQFASDNPQIISAALNAGMVVATLGAIGLALTAGFKLYVDTKFLLASGQNLAAGELMIQAARLNLEAAMAQTAFDELQTKANSASRNTSFAAGNAAAAKEAELLAYERITQAQALAVQAQAEAAQVIATASEAVAVAQAEAAATIQAATVAMAEAQATAEVAATEAVLAATQAELLPVTETMAAAVAAEQVATEAIAASQTITAEAQSVTIAAAEQLAVAEAAAMAEIAAAQASQTAALNAVAQAQMQAMLATERTAETAIAAATAELQSVKAAAMLQSVEAPVVTAAASTGLSGIMSTVTSYIIPIIVAATAAYMGAQGGLAAGNWANKQIYGQDTPDQNMGDVWKTMREAASIVNPVTAAAAALNALGLISKDTQSSIWNATKGFFGLNDAVDSTGRKVVDVAKALADAEALKNGIKIIQQLEKDLAKLAENEAKEEIRIKQRADKEMITAANNYEKALRHAADSLAASIAKINSSYANDTAQADHDFETERARIIRDANEEALRAEQKHKDDLAKLEREHERNVYSLAMERDALGLVNENRRYSDAVNDSNLAYQRDKQQREQELQDRLADQQQAYEDEKAQRYQQYLEQLAEAQAKYEEDVKQAAIEKAAKEKQIQEDKAQALIDLKERTEAERILLLTNAYNRLHDLAEVLANEQELKKAYYAAMSEDLNTFLATFQQTLAEGMTAGLSTNDLIPAPKTNSKNPSPENTPLAQAAKTAGSQEKEKRAIGSSENSSSLFKRAPSEEVVQKNSLLGSPQKEVKNVMEVNISSDGMSIKQTIEIARTEAKAMGDLLVTMLTPLVEG